MAKTTTKTNTQTKCLKNPTYAIFLKSWWLTHSKFDDRYLTLVILFTLVILVSLFRSYNQFYRAECITVSGFFSIFKEGGGDSIWDRARCLSPDFWQKSVVSWVSGKEKMLTGRRQPVGPDEGERGGEKWPLDKDYQGQVCLVQGYIWCVLIRAQMSKGPSKIE